MSYVDALHNKDTDEIQVVERVNRQRVYRNIPAKYTFYYEDPHGGRYKDMWGRPVSKVVCNSTKAYQKEVRSQGNRQLFESDVKPVVQCLAENYLGAEAPELNIGFFDIEVDFDPQRGFASPWDPFSPVTAISLYTSYEQKMITLVIKPELPVNDKGHLSWDAAEAITKEFENCILCNDERELLTYFLELIEDTDVLTGWNSKGFDIPYLVNRIERLMGKDFSKKMCLWGQRPRKRKYIQFKQEKETYELIGRIHLDYLDLYRKHNPQELHSYRLDFVGEVEVKEKKVAYEGSLDHLYKYDFKKFIEYNRQDTMLLVKIDEKKKFIELANQLAHTNTVLLPTTMGSVALIEQSIINEAHERGMVVPNRKNSWTFDSDDDDVEEDKPVVGAYVAVPKVGIHNEIGCCDINSLYPSTLRALNMGPETLVGQIRSDRTIALIESRIAQGWKRADVWQNIFATLEYDIVLDKSDEVLTVDFEDGQTLQLTGLQLYQYIYEQGHPYCMSANGTIFRTDAEAIIPGLLARWYKERKEMQGKEREYLNLKDAETDPVKKAEYRALEVFWNQRQQARKILLNSLYGALLNEGCRFYDQRIGQSVTLTGRSIARHMNSKINELITGKYQIDGEAIIYADTDSSYFTAYHMLKDDPEMKSVLDDRQSIIDLYNGIGDTVNSSFPEYMNRAFNTGEDRGAIIKAGRELVAGRGLFITKKRYALLVYDVENKRQDVDGKPGKIKAMGLDLKRADTPKIMQEFLEEILLNLLDGKEKQDIIQMITDFRVRFRDLDGWLKGTPKKVNGITGYRNRTTDGDGQNIMKSGTKQKVMIPGHVQAAMHWNKLREMYGDKYSMEIQDGQKVIVCKLKPNPLKMDSVAYPIDEPHLPQWYKELPFDHETMESTIIDMKVDNLIGVLKWDLRETRVDTTFNDLFSF
jgi:DNA polymerase elongation subunit (family B)